MIAENESSSTPIGKPRKPSHKSKRQQLGMILDPLSLPPSVVTPIGKRYCFRCYRYKYEHCFTNDQPKTCDTCYKHLQDLAEIVASDPDYDDKIAKLNEELKRETNEINLPRVADLLTEFWAQEGGVKEAIAKLRYNLDYLDNFKPGSATAMNLRMGMLKLQVAYEAVQLARAKQEKMPSVQDAMNMVDEMISNFAKVANGSKVPAALAGLGANDDGMTIDMDAARATLAQMVRAEEDEEEDDLEMLLGKAADEHGKENH